MANFGDRNGPGNTVSEFAAGSTTPSVTYSGVSDPVALVVDSAGNLYVASYGESTITEFAAGSTTASATYSDGVFNPTDMAFDPFDDALYATNQGDNSVSEFPLVELPVNTYSGNLSDPQGLAFDSSGNLYVSNVDTGTVSVFAAGSNTPTATLTAVGGEPYDLAVDSSGNLYVASFDQSTVSEFTPGSTTASIIYSAGVSSPYALTIGPSGNLFVAAGQRYGDRIRAGEHHAQPHVLRRHISTPGSGVRLQRQPVRG